VLSVTGLAALAVLVLCLSVGPAEAKKPPKPPPPPVDSGTIYLALPVDAPYRMDPDGTDLTQLTAVGDPSPEYGVTIEASDELHGDERWFLQFRPYDSDPEDDVTERYPTGTIRHELYAVSETGTAVRLTADLTLEPDNVPGNSSDPGDESFSLRAVARWSTNGTVVDGKVSWLAKRWAKDANDEWYISEWGLYVVTLDPDDLGTDATLDLTPSRIDIDFYLHETTWGGLLNFRYDWSPAGTSIVYALRYGDVGRLYRADESAGSWALTDLQTYGEAPRWSPTGDLIAVQRGGGIGTLTPSGSNPTTIVPVERDIRMAHPIWSPSGTHLIYQRSRFVDNPRKNFSDIYRVEVDGDNPTNLTEDIDGWATPKGWGGE
jgi:hypothetical protein